MSEKSFLDAGTETQEFIICAKKVSEKRLAELKKEYDKYKSEERIKMGKTDNYNFEERENVILMFNQDIAFHEKLIEKANNILGLPND